MKLRIDSKKIDRSWCATYCAAWHKTTKRCGKLFSAYLEGFDCGFDEDDKQAKKIEAERDKAINSLRKKKK